VTLITAAVAMLTPVAPAAADETRDSQWHLGFLRITEAHRVSTGRGVAVAVIDTGVDASHPDLAGAITAGTDFVGGDGRRDSNGHGTAMAGLVAARGRAGGGGALGVAPGAEIITINGGGATSPLLADAIDWAVQRKVRVICIAIAGTGDSRLESAVARAVAADVVVVAGAGNRPSVGVQAPARYPGVVAAAGVDAAGKHAEVSVTGSEVVISAPAVNVVSTALNGGYLRGTGTSSATAIIAGAAALVRARFPQLTAPEVIHRLTATAIDKGKPGRDEEYGFGVVDLVAALTNDVPPASTGSAEALPPPGNGSASSAAWLVGGLLLAAAGAGVVVALRRTGRAGRAGESGGAGG
jgi:subtilisin family serine protease